MRLLCVLTLGIALALTAGSAMAEPPEAYPGERERAHEDLDLPAPAKAKPWSLPLMPIFETAAKRHDVPLPLLLTLGYFGSAFENRGGAPTIERGYGVMALRENMFGADSLGEGARLTGVPKAHLKVNPVANINAGAAVLSSYAKRLHVDRSRGLEAWLEPIIEFAGLDEENNRFFAMEIFQKLQDGLDWANTPGERFAFPPRDIGSVSLEDLAPSFVIQSADYPPAIWDPAPTCNYSAYYTSKDTVLVHTIEGTAAGCRAWFKNCASNVSAHYVIAESGTIWQMVSESYKAWHVSCYNDRSIGLEHEGYAASPSHPQSLYDASALLTRDICNDWGIPKEKRSVGPGILGHIDVTICCCGTHWDPGSGWDWTYYINQVVGAPPPPTWAASYYAQSYPSTMTAGDTAIVWVEYTNTGTGDWKHAETRLGTSSPQDRCSPFYNSSNWVNCSRPTDVDQWKVSTGEVGCFTFILKAPTTPGTYVEKYKLVREGVTWFGDEITWTITVNPGMGNITGTVRNSANGQAIAGATVDISGGPSTTTNSSGVYTLSDLAPATYTLNVSKSGFSPASDTATVTAGATTVKDFNLISTDTTAPSVPTGLVATGVSPSQINLSWNASTDSGGSGLAGYIVYRNGSEAGRTSATSYEDNGVAPNTTYSYYIKAYDNANNVSGPSATVWASTHPGTVPIFEDGFANTDYWEAIVQSPMPGAYPPVLTSEKNHGTFSGINSLRTRTSSDPYQGCLIGHSFDPAFGAARFESYFFDGTGLGYSADFEGTTEGWMSYPLAYATLSSVGGGVSGNCLQASDGGWTSGVCKEFTSGFTPGESYLLSMWVKWPPPPSGKSYSTPPRCFVRFFDSGGGEIRTDYSSNINTDSNWRRYTVSGTVPSGTAKIWIGHWGVLAATNTYQYFADSVEFNTSTAGVVKNNSRQGLQVRCLTPTGGIKAIYYVGTCSAGGPSGSDEYYTVGYYKVCGAGCTGWYWTYFAKQRTAGWHKFALDFLPYTGSGDVKAYIDDILVATLDRTQDTQIYGLNMVAYGFHYRVNQESWFDDCAMYASAPWAPTIGTPAAISNSTIRWTMTDNSNNEIGFKVQDESQAIKGTAPFQDGTGATLTIDEGGLAPNAPYTRFAKAYNGTLDSLPTASATRWTLSNPPTVSNVTCHRTVGVWYDSPAFTFSAVGGFGHGTVDKYRFAWDTSPTHTWTESESVWNSGALILLAPSSGSYYLHVKGYNGEGAANGTLDLGPYRFDDTPPQNPTSAIETGGAPDGAWQSATADPAFTWSGASDAHSGIADYLAYFGAEETGTSTTVVPSAAYDPPAVGTGTYYLRVCARDAAGNQADEWATLFTFKYDASAPATPTVTDDGPYTGSTTILHATWHSTDPDSGVVEYMYAVGTSAGSADVVGWTSAGGAQEADIPIPGPGLSVGPTYYVSVKARNAADSWSDAGSSDGIQVADEVATIAAAKALPDGTPVALANKVVTGSFPGSYYTQEADRSSGILVLGAGPDAGALVTVGGTMGLNAVGERVILDAATIVEAAPDPLRIPRPLLMVGQWVAGGEFNAYTPGTTADWGLNNVGLLVCVYGWVESPGEREFWVNDGSAVEPTKVVATGIDIGGLSTADFVLVTGIASLELDGAVRKPIIRVRGLEDIGKRN